MEQRLVIFDCDGVLVDSETLSAEVLRTMTAPELALTSAEALALLRGRKVALWVQELGERLGRPLGEEFIAAFRRRTLAAFTDGLLPVPGVHDLLAGLSLPYCTASSAPREKITHTLSVTGLLPYFEGRIFSAYEVGSWKPEPDLFLHAAHHLGTPAHRCAVVEDSLVGVQAAVAARMTVFGYAPPGSGTAAELAEAGASVFTSMAELPALLGHRLATTPPAPAA
ncbi:HAD family hydrolase [Streptomyces sp. NBC_01171]|uniref:HAD family hydrolase n=1 Tax=Streptomyces sp. NBC_01171 TaxID=2903757 RepID=UPI0038654AFB|nr:HAD family hydrolase [Streptomyces sp. NBC_01171]